MDERVTSVEQGIIEKLVFEPSLDHSKIYIKIDEGKGIVTLLGSVNTLLEKQIAENAVKGVIGVRTVANELNIDNTAKHCQYSDVEIASAAIHALKWQVPIAEDAIQVSVDSGCVTLTGHVDWWYQRDIAEETIRRLPGVSRVDNQINIRPSFAIKDIKKSIMREYHRNASVDADKIIIEVVGKKVTLSGSVSSWSEIKEASRAAWSVPGVAEVDNQLTVGC